MATSDLGAASASASKTAGAIGPAAHQPAERGTDFLEQFDELRSTMVNWRLAKSIVYVRRNGDRTGQQA